MKGNSKKKGTSKSSKFSKRQRAVESADMSKNPTDTRFDADNRDDSNRHYGKPNDWQWYAANAQLIKDYASFPFGVPVGNQLGFGLSQLDSGSIPGVMVLNYYPTVGVTNAESAPINIAMRKLYSYIRHANSGHANYDPADLMLYVICVDSALMYLEWMKRLYAVMRDYTPLNRYYPQTLIRAMNVLPAGISDLNSKMSDFRGYINIFAAKLSQLWIPGSLTMTARHLWMTQGIYLDSMTSKAQTYLYNPAGFYQFNLNTEGVGYAKMTSPGLIDSLEAMITYGDSLLNPMVTSEDFGIIGGDILKAYGAAGIVKPLGITEEYQVLPVYNQEVLSQIENATIVGNPIISTFDVTQATAVGTGYLISNPKTQVGLMTHHANGTNAVQNALAPYTANRILNFHHDAPSPEEVMVATRLMVAIDSISVSAGDTPGQYLATLTIDQCGTEVIGNCQYFRFVGKDSSRTYRNDFVQYVLCLELDHTQTATGYVDGLNAAISNITALSTFDWHPVCFPLLYASYGEETVFNYPVGVLLDVDNYTFLTKYNLYNLHQTALLSEFTTPQI